ncbi:MAG: HAMP domain-containing sensor histidine kinase [Kibdelosporangium sp.]
MNRRWGLRTRLLLAFAALCVLTAAAVAGGIYIKARDVILQKAQDAAVLTMTERVSRFFPIRSLPLSQDELAEISGAVADRTNSAVVLSGGRKSLSSLDPDSLPAELLREVRAGRVAWQRVERHGEPVLIIGTQLTFKQPNRVSRASGVEIYVVRSLKPEQDSIAQLATRAWLIGGLALAFAMLLAVLAARGVLRPVRQLHQAAHRLGEGDLTTRLRVRGSDELADVARTFNDTAAVLEHQVSELRRMEADARRFVADVSHELRTPLAAMAAVTDVLDEEAPRLPGDAGRAARLVSQETKNLTRLVNDLIEISRFDSGAAALTLDDIDMAEAIQASLRTRGWLDQVETDLPRGITARVDPRRLDLVIANLAGNALRHGAPPVRIRLRAEPGWVTVEVGDQGPGLGPDVLPHVFDRFYKADTARSRSEGSGLGLAIAWENARLHQGTLLAANASGGGAVFTLRLPGHQL